MYTVPSYIRTQLSNKFSNCDIVYKSSIEEITVDDFDIYWGNRLPLDFTNIFRSLKWIHFGSVGIDRYLKCKDWRKEKILITNSKTQ